LVPALVPSTELQQAVALNAGLMNSTRIIGPGIGAISIKYWGIAGGFYVNSASFLGVVAACALVRTRPRLSAVSVEPFRERLAAGFSYARSNATVGWLLLLIG